MAAAAIDYSAALQKAFGAQVCTTPRMLDAIREWRNLYFCDHMIPGEDPCQQIAYTIVRKLSKTTFAEYTATHEGQDAYTDLLLDVLHDIKSQAMQEAMIGGESLIKPVPTLRGMDMRVIGRSSYMVFARDASGNLTDIGSYEITTHGRYYYTLLERRTVNPQGYLTITTKLYQSASEGALGNQVPLSVLPEYADLVEDLRYSQPIGSIGLIPVRMPAVNNVDGSDEPVSVYSAAVQLIHRINANEAQINGEFERAESRIMVSGDLLAPRSSELEAQQNTALRDHVFTALDEDPETVGINIYSPAIREASFLARKAEYLRNVESVIGLKRGLLSEVEAVERTATEITSSEGDYSLTISDMQQAWERALEETLRVCGLIGTIYRVPGAHEIDPSTVAVDWGNGVLYDRDKAWEDYRNMVATGLLKPEIALGWRFGLDTDTPEQLQQIRDKYMPTGVDDGSGF